MKRILIVNGHIDFLRNLAAFLQLNGFEAEYTKNHEETPVMIKSFNPDILLVDILDESVLGLLQGGELSGVKTLIMTGHPGQYPLSVWKVDGYIEKPFSGPELIEKIKRIEREQPSQ